MFAVRQLVVALALGSTPLHGVAAQAGQALAVGSFETDGSVGMDRDAYTALGRALGHVLTTELQARLDRPIVALPGTASARPGRIDVAAARQAGLTAGAGFILVGSLLDQYGDIHIEARIINATSGDPVAVVRGDPTLASRAQLGEAMGALADSVAAHAGFTRRAGATASRRSLPADALVQFGRGLGFEEAGDRTKAADALRAAVRAAPGFREAAAALARVGG
jgi:TolB-like protein